MSHKHYTLSRRDFLKTTVVGLGGAVLASCKRNTTISPVTAIPDNTPTVPTGATANTIFHNGTILTVDSGNSVSQAVAISGNQIMQVGKNEAILALVQPDTQVIDLAGRVLSPGLIDPHFHLAYLDLLNQMIPFLSPEVKIIADMVAKLKDVVAQTPKGEWIQIYFMTLEEGRMPTRQELDVVSPDNPVWIIQQGGHLGCSNSMALQLANISADTPNPPGGIIERDQNGEPTGLFYNHRAMNVLRSAIPKRPVSSIQTSIIEGQHLLLSSGVTTFHDVYAYGMDVINAYMQAGKNGEMVVQGAVYPVLENPGEVNHPTGLEHYNDPFMRLGGYKLQVDGSALTAYCHEPTKGIAWDKPAWPEDDFKKTVRALHDTGLQICVHCVGDAAVDLTLDAFEEAMNANPRPDPRHRIEHCVLTKPNSTQRIKDLGVVISNTASFTLMAGDLYVETYGQERADRLLVAREWLEAGIPMALGTDYPTTPWPQPQMTLASAIARLTASGKVLNPKQCLTFEEALRAFTMGSAYAGFEENIKGSIEPGKLADMIVWTKDPRTLDAKELALTTTVDMTFVGGKLVYPAA